MARARASDSWSVGVASILAVAAKLTALPVVLGMALALAWRYRGVAGRVGRRVLLGAGAVGVVAGLVVYARLLGEPPSTSRWASMAHFWPRTLWIAVPEYVRGGLAESFGTFWYAYDYAVRWPLSMGAALALVGAVLLLGATVGLVWAGARKGSRALLCALPLLLWLGAGAQVATVILRFGFGTVLQIEMGGVAQAKGFFPALLPLALLFTWGWAALVSGPGRAGRALAHPGHPGRVLPPGLDQPGRDALAPLPMAASRAVGGVPERAPERVPSRLRCTCERGRASGRHCWRRCWLSPGARPWPWPCWPWCCACCTCASRRGRTSPTTPSSSRSTPDASWRRGGPWGRRRSGPGCGRRSTTPRCRGCSIRSFSPWCIRWRGAWRTPRCWWRRPSWGP